MTPLEIEVALHRFYIAPGTPYPRPSEPARRALARLVDAGLVECKDGVLTPTQGLRTYVEALCAVPFPVQT